MKGKNQVHNPFSVTSYLGSDYFCDREDETKKLRDALSNGRNITLISPRKIGKQDLSTTFFIPFQQMKPHVFMWIFIKHDLCPTLLKRLQKRF